MTRSFTGRIHKARGDHRHKRLLTRIHCVNEQLPCCKLQLLDKMTATKMSF